MALPLGLSEALRRCCRIGPRTASLQNSGLARRAVFAGGAFSDLPFRLPGGQPCGTARPTGPDNRRLRGARWSHIAQVEWAGGWVAQFLHNMGIDHGRFHMRVAQEVLNLADVDTVQQEVRGKACRRVCTVTGLWIWAVTEARLTAFWRVDSLT